MCRRSLTGLSAPPLVRALLLSQQRLAKPRRSGKVMVTKNHHQLWYLPYCRFGDYGLRLLFGHIVEYNRIQSIDYYEKRNQEIWSKRALKK